MRLRDFNKKLVIALLPRLAAAFGAFAGTRLVLQYKLSHFRQATLNAGCDSKVQAAHSRLRTTRSLAGGQLWVWKLQYNFIRKEALQPVYLSWIIPGDARNTYPKYIKYWGGEKKKGDLMAKSHH